MRLLHAPNSDWIGMTLHRKDAQGLGWVCFIAQRGDDRIRDDQATSILPGKPLESRAKFTISLITVNSLRLGHPFCPPQHKALRTVAPRQSIAARIIQTTTQNKEQISTETIGIYRQFTLFSYLGPLMRGGI